MQNRDVSGEPSDQVPQQWGSQPPTEPQQWGSQPPSGPQQWGNQPSTGPQYPYARYQPPQPPKKGHRGRNIALAVGGGIVVLIVIAGVAGSGKSNSSAAAASAPTTSRVGAAAPATTRQATQPATQAAAPATSVAPAKTIVLSISGNGISSTKTFTIAGTDYSVAYTYDCSSFGSQGNFIADVEQSGDSLFDDPVANEIGTKGASTTYLHDGPGTDYISVNSECSWTLKVTDGDDGQ